MRNIIIPLFFLSSFLSFSQNEKLDAVIYWKYVNEVKVFNKPNGDVVETIQNDTITENLIHLTISQVQSNFFKVVIGLEMNSETYSGWIKSADYIGAHHRRENYPMNLILYSHPKEKNKNIIMLTDWYPGFITILNYNKDWVYVSVDYERKKQKGWIKRNQLCANSYSTCS